jgi:hypothetical protein
MSERLAGLLDHLTRLLAPSPSILSEESSEIIIKNIGVKIDTAKKVWDIIYYDGYKPAKEAIKDLKATASVPPLPSRSRAEPQKLESVPTEDLMRDIQKIADTFLARVKAALLEPSARIRKSAEDTLNQVVALRKAHKEITANLEEAVTPIVIEFFTTMDPVVSSFYAVQNGMGRRIDEILRRAGATVVKTGRPAAVRREGDVLMTVKEMEARLNTVINGLSVVLANGDHFAEKFKEIVDEVERLVAGIPEPGKAPAAEPAKEPVAAPSEAPVNEGRIQVPSAVMIDPDDIEE